MPEVNEHGQQVGDSLEGWTPPLHPPWVPLRGRTTEVEPLDWSHHGNALFETFAAAGDDLWTYMTFGPFASPDRLQETVAWMTSQEDCLPYAISVDGEPLGFASYLRINPSQGVIEVGAITLSPPLQRTTAATEALCLMIRNIFRLGYRRCEWKCDCLNEASRRAGERLGFRYEGTFRKAMHYKGRNRDTAWFAMTDDEWPSIDEAYSVWLSPDNFDERGVQRRRLSDVIEAARS